MQILTVASRVMLDGKQKMKQSGTKLLILFRAKKAPSISSLVADNNQCINKSVFLEC